MTPEVLAAEEQLENDHRELEQKITVFMEKHKDDIERMQDTFRTGDYETFLSLPEALRSLGNFYVKEVGQENFDVELPTRILEAVATSEYINRQEVVYRSLPQEDGLYIPLAEEGGDFWFKSLRSAGVGSVTRTVELLDMAGHSRDAAAMKAFLARLVELYHATYQAGGAPEKPHLLDVLDQFLAQCPFLSPSAEYTEVRITDITEHGLQIEVERAADAPIFVRDQSTGKVTLIEEDKEKGRPALGTVHIRGNVSPSQVTTVATQSADVYICSDGVFDILLKAGDKRGEKFRSVFRRFCAQREHRTPEEFKRELFAYIAKAKEEGRVIDDVTVIVLSAEGTNSVAAQ